jgi:lipoyl(octanoyl) transferase
MTNETGQPVVFRDLGTMEYKAAWDLQESLLQEIVSIKSLASNQQPQTTNYKPQTKSYLLFVEHPPVLTIGKSGKMENMLISEKYLASKGIGFFMTNRGGDITFHGPEQIVGYPILDLENFFTDIGKYLRCLEEVIILTMAEYGLKGERSAGETGVWIDASIPAKARKICAMGVRCSRWVTMHGFAFNVNTDLSYFNYIIPCGIQNKQVTSMQKELGLKLNMDEVKESVRRNFEKVFEARLVPPRRDGLMVGPSNP